MKIIIPFILMINYYCVGIKLGKFTEVYAWKQITYDINGAVLLQDRFSENRRKREDDFVFADDRADIGGEQSFDNSSTLSPSDGRGRYFIKYNNVPMGVERVGDRLFVTLPRRRYGIPATLNYVNLQERGRSPELRPYPNVEDRSLISVYRTRADECGRLWMVDTGLLEIPGDPQQIRPPAIVIYNLSTDRQILRYDFKTSDIPAANTPTGLASITIDINGDCEDAFAYVPDLTTFGLIVFSLKDRDSWRLTHNYFHFNPIAGNLQVSGQFFQWSDGLFSITLTPPARCRTAYFHPLISTEEFSVSTCLLKNKTASSDRYYFDSYNYVGDRGRSSQSTMHGYHEKTGVIFFADIGRDAVSCWNSGNVLNPANVAVLVRDGKRMSYPSDLHITGDEVWVMANTLPRFGYSRLDPNEYNFYVYRANVYDLISDTVCQSKSMFD
ncbi:L-dopachrome tautomerase yellow-f2-like [Danaus plexippus]|uniref:L-dopachrome tautomerase yellow-f2-like n=1 Tax=Danaus plexippus TaxID=13037 RepID=UPI002AB0D17D|nr:L-dopachrome tautomerase yellow-f2-like [Danaus plexippus]